MAIEKRMCAFHPDRLAIGVCVETKVPICGECSTRYEGVNYSKEGLRLMQARRDGKTAKAGSNGFGRRAASAIYSLVAIGCVYVMYLGYDLLFGGMTELLYPSDAKTADAAEQLHKLLDLLGQ